MSNHSKGLMMISITAVLWGILAIVLKYALQRFSGNTIIWFRFTFSLVFLAGYYLIHRPQFFEILIKPPILGILAGLAMAGNYLGFTSGVALTSPSNAQILIQISPLLVAVVGVVYFKERLTLLQKSGFGIAAAGFLLFYWDQLHHLVISSQQYSRGNLWIIFAAITWAFFAVCQKLLVRIWAPQQTNLLIYLVAALIFSPLAVFHEFQGLSPFGLADADLSGRQYSHCLWHSGRSPETAPCQPGQRHYRPEPADYPDCCRCSFGSEASLAFF